MKKAIDKAIKNGFNLASWAFDDQRLKLSRYYVHIEGMHIYSGGKSYTQYGGSFRGKNAYMKYYELIFGTPFIDKLVDCEDEFCLNDNCSYNEHGYEGNCAGWADGESSLAAGCNQAVMGVISPKQHREKLSNMALEDMKVYIRKLAQDTQ